MFPANARALLLPPSGRCVLLGDGRFRFPVVGRARHRAALDELSKGRRLRRAALLTPGGGDYDPDSVTVTMRDLEVGFLPWMDGREFRGDLRRAGFAEAVCGAEITNEHSSGDSWDYVGVCLDAFLPFTFVAPDDWHKGKRGLD